MRDALLEGANYAEDKVLGYLESGYTLIDMMGRESDILDDETSIPGGSSIMTDGEWIWRQDLIYYVRRYSLHLPYEFASVATRLERVPALDLATLSRLTRKVLRELGYTTE